MGFYGFRGLRFRVLSSLLQQPGPKKVQTSKIELIYKANKFKVSSVHNLSKLERFRVPGFRAEGIDSPGWVGVSGFRVYGFAVVGFPTCPLSWGTKG